MRVRHLKIEIDGAIRPYMLIKFMIGSNNITKELEKDKIVKFFSEKVDGFTAYEAMGYWKGEKEKSMVVEVGNIDMPSAAQFSKELCKILDQEAIGITRSDDIQFIGK